MTNEQQAQATTEQKVPSIFVIVGGLAFLLALILNVYIAIVGILVGIYMLVKYPQKKVHGIVAIVLNLFVFVFKFWLMSLFFFI